jgi:hypothetical protein
LPNTNADLVLEVLADVTPAELDLCMEALGTEQGLIFLFCVAVFIALGGAGT